MNCKNTQSLLSAYIDEELTGREMIEIRAHLGECDLCAAEARCVEGVKRFLGGSPVPEPSPDFEDRLVSHVLSATGVATEQRKLSVFTLTGIAAVSMLATMMLLNTFRHEVPTVSEQNDNIPYDVMRQNSAFDWSSGSGGSPAMYAPKHR
jgi:anti-sigma factor RsiW